MRLPADTPFTSSQADQWGLTSAHRRRLVRDGTLRTVLHTVYAPAGLADTIELRARCLSLVMQPHQVVADHTAAWLHGVDHYRIADLATPPAMDVVSLSGCGRPRRPQVHGGERDLAPEDIEEVGGVRVTTPARTAADLGCRLGRRDALAVLDGFMRISGVTTDELLGLLPRFARRRGVVQLRELVPRATPAAESRRESWCRLEVEDAGLPSPEPQFWVIHDGVPVYRLDLAWPRLKVAVEYDGEEFHDVEQQSADRARRQWLRDHGWIVIVVRKGGFHGPALDAWLTELRHAIQERTPAPAKRRYARASDSPDRPSRDGSTAES